MPSSGCCSEEPMQSDLAVAYRATRRRYELGRLATALRRSGVAAIAVAFVSAIVLGRRALEWLFVVFIVVALTEWRGASMMKGARRGLVTGLGAMLLPLSVLRPCCRLDA